jgi:hypothetical protein
VCTGPCPTYPALDKRKALIQKKSSQIPNHVLRKQPGGINKLVLTGQFQHQWRTRQKWIEERLLYDVGRLEEHDVVELTGLGLATVLTVVSIHSANDLLECKGPRLTGLGLTLPSTCSQDFV